MSLARLSLYPAVHDRAELLRRAERCLTGVEFDTVVVTGMSGVLAAPILGQHFDVDVFALRKPFDFSGSQFGEEGFLGARWLFVDDVIHSGRTLRDSYRRVEGLARDNDHATRFVGAFTYNGPGDYGKFYCAFDPLLVSIISA